MFSIQCSGNPLTALPTLPLQLDTLECHSCTLSSLPTLPVNLRVLKCEKNPLETLPELPFTLEEMHCELPWVEDIDEDVARGGPMIYNALWPEMVGAVNQMVREAAVLTNRQSKKRCTTRCATYKEEIMMTVWHPKRVAILIEMGIDLEDVM